MSQTLILYTVCSWLECQSWFQSLPEVKIFVNISLPSLVDNNAQQCFVGTGVSLNPLSPFTFFHVAMLATSRSPAVNIADMMHNANPKSLHRKTARQRNTWLKVYQMNLYHSYSCGYNQCIICSQETVQSCRLSCSTTRNGWLWSRQAPTNLNKFNHLFNGFRSTKIGNWYEFECNFMQSWSFIFFENSKIYLMSYDKSFESVFKTE